MSQYIEGPYYNILELPLLGPNLEDALNYTFTKKIEIGVVLEWAGQMVN